MVRSCAVADLYRTKHGCSRKNNRSPEYDAWAAMHQRVRARGDQNKCYAGVKICKRWRDFQNFLEDMGPKPTRGHSLDRIDNSRGYEPTNCRWATRQEQMRNRSVTVLDDGLTLAEISAQYGIKHDTIKHRYYLQRLRGNALRNPVAPRRTVERR